MASPNLKEIWTTKLSRTYLLGVAPVVACAGWLAFVFTQRPHAPDVAAGFIYPLQMKGGGTTYLSLPDIVIVAVLFILAFLGMGVFVFQFRRAVKAATRNRSEPPRTVL